MELLNAVRQAFHPYIELAIGLVLFIVIPKYLIIPAFKPLWQLRKKVRVLKNEVFGTYDELRPLLDKQCNALPYWARTISNDDAQTLRDLMDGAQRLMQTIEDTKVASERRDLIPFWYGKKAYKGMIARYETIKDELTKAGYNIRLVSTHCNFLRNPHLYLGSLKEHATAKLNEAWLAIQAAHNDNLPYEDLVRQWMNISCWADQGIKYWNKEEMLKAQEAFSKVLSMADNFISSIPGLKAQKAECWITIDLHQKTLRSLVEFDRAEVRSIIQRLRSNMTPNCFEALDDYVDVIDFNINSAQEEVEKAKEALENNVKNLATVKLAIFRAEYHIREAQLIVRIIREFDRFMEDIVTSQVDDKVIDEVIRIVHGTMVALQYPFLTHHKFILFCQLDKHETTLYRSKNRLDLDKPDFISNLRRMIEALELAKECLDSRFQPKLGLKMKDIDGLLKKLRTQLSNNRRYLDN